MEGWICERVEYKCVHGRGRETHRGEARGEEGSLSGGCADWMRDDACFESSMFSASSDGLSDGGAAILRGRVKCG